MKGKIVVEQIPDSCLECYFCKDYMRHALGEYWPKYTASKTDRPDWCPIREDDKTK